MVKEKAVYTVEEMGEVLGISRATAYALVHSEDGPPVVRIGRCIRIPVAGLNKWMKERADKPW